MSDTSLYGIVFDRQEKTLEVGLWEDIKTLEDFSSSDPFGKAFSTDETAAIKKMFSVFIQLIVSYGFDPRDVHRAFMVVPSYNSSQKIEANSFSFS
ncbi:hypothetical protein M2305_002216 [Gluconobacter cerinus]|uniref:hypothetical protein n=1 Tax=Gluconobacter cerinus TaxID=38307 RepID=UPI002226FFBA|nr:hypothetical protein [Gluconobacter cerinus]MCW2266269.1 hypothetical protein [Gluconobacter cerinus]